MVVKTFKAPLLSLLFTALFVCFAEAQAPVRLASNRGTSPSSNNAGRLEIFLNGQWGTVCDDSFSLNDATVACRQLGYDGYIFYDTVGNVGYERATSSVPIWLDDLRCTSFDTAIESCSHSGIGVDNCNHSEDVALSCYQRGSLRLVSSSSNYDTSSGRLEIFLNGEWGTVCDDSFGSTDATVACRQLGYSGVNSGFNSYGNVGQLGYTAASFSVRIWMDDLACSSSDTSLIECPFDADTGDCRHSEDVAIVCSTVTVSPTVTPTVPSSVAPLRLVSNEGTGTFSNNNAGRLEIFLNGQWGTVCDDRFSSSDATVACRQLGYDGYIFYDTVGDVGYERATSSVPIWLDELGCTSSDTAIESCSHNGIGIDDCSHSEDVALSCYQRGSLRLVTSFSTHTTSSGRLEIYLNGEWGTVCDDSFGSTDATVACRQLGYSGVNSGSNGYGNVGQLGYTSASYSVSIWLDEVTCFSSTTATLLECSYSDTNDCSHSEDVALSCMDASGSSFNGGGSSTSVSSGAVVGIIVGVLSCVIPFGIVIAVVSCSCCAGAAGSRGRRRHRGTAPHVLTTNVQPATTTTVFTTQTAQDSTLPAQQPQYTGAYPTTPQQPPAPFAPKPDSVLYPQEAPPPYPGLQFPLYPQQPPQAYPGTTTETGTAPYPTNDPPAYPPPTNPGYPQAGAGGDPGYPPQAVGGLGYPPQAVGGPGYPPQAIGGPGYPPQTVGGPGYPLQATDDPAYPPQAGSSPGYPTN